VVEVGARAEVERLADWQAALRRVATLVAQDARPRQTFNAVAEEVAQLFDLPWVGVMRYDPDDHFTVVATWGDHPFPAGSRWPLDGPSTFEIVRRTESAARLDDYTGLTGTVAEAARGAGIIGGIGAPIVVEGTTWGMIGAPITRDRAIPDGAEAQLSEFTELVATAIANAESRRAFARLADEQAALRRVATLVAGGAPPIEVFRAVTHEVGRLFSGDWTYVTRFDSDYSVTVLAGWMPTGDPPVELPGRWTAGPTSEAIRATGAPIRLDPYPRRDPVEDPETAVVAAPITIEGALWGFITVASTTPERPPPPGTEARLSSFTELVATAIANAESREAIARLADEQAALRRVATLAARESAPVDVLVAVTEEAARVLETEAVGLLRFEHDGSATLVAQSQTPWDPPPLGTRFTLEGENLIAWVHRTGRAARMDDWADATGSVAAMADVLGVRSAVATPIAVEGRLWGAMVAATSQSEPLPADTEARTREFTELVATAIANAESREALGVLAEEQAALRRVAVLVAQHPSPEEVFTAVTEAVAPLLGADLTAMHMFMEDGTARVIAGWSGNGPMLPLETRLPLDGDSAAARIFQTGAAARIDSYVDVEGETAGVARGLGLRSTVGAPIVVEGRLWGALMAATRGDEPLAQDAEARIAEFTELVATAVSNADSRAALGLLADEQAALRRVATLVAEGALPGDVFSAVSREVERAFGFRMDTTATVVRFDPGPECVLVGASKPVAETPLGTRWQPNDLYVSTRVLRTGASARVDEADLDAGGFAAEQMRRQGYLSQVASPIAVEGNLWGAMTVSAGETLPPDTERRLEAFTELVATAIANAESREALGELADEQAALRRVATLVARGVPSRMLFSAVTTEVARVLSVDEPPLLATVIRFDPGPECVLVGASRSYEGEPIGSRWAPKELYVSTRVLRTGLSARVDEADLDAIGGPDADALRLRGFLHQVGSPVVVEGRVWGAMTLNSQTALPADIDHRLRAFTELVATAIANAESQSELAASRRRVVAAADDARRRIERDLHDGVQQQLVSIGMELGAVEASLPEEDERRAQVEAVADGLRSAIDDLREISRGIHPAILAHGGLGAALKTLARRSAVPVQLTSTVDGRLPERVEVAAYYVVAEALTNVARHAGASVVNVDVAGQDGTLQLSIRDDGVGGADAREGTGLMGLKDRVEALGGRMSVESPPARGTSLVVALPLGSDTMLETED
jgi:signal transduction histidine kinase